MAALPLLKIAGSIAASLAVPVGKLTLKMIRNAKIPVRYKKALQGQTQGEKQIAPTVKSSRQTAIQEAKAVGTIGALIGGSAIAKQIYDVAQKTKGGENKPHPLGQKRTKFRNKRAMEKTIDSALKQQQADKRREERKKSGQAARNKPSGAVLRSSPPLKRPKTGAVSRSKPPLKRPKNLTK